MLVFYRRISSLVFLFIFVFSFLLPIFILRGEAHAENFDGKGTLTMSFTWIDRAHIKVEGLSLTASDTSVLSAEANDVRENYGGIGAVNTELKKNEGTYKDDNLLDDSARYTRDSGVCSGFVSGGWTFTIDGLKFNTGNNTAKYSLQDLAMSKFKCFDNFWNDDYNRQDKQEQIREVQNRDIWFKYNTDDEIERVDNGEKFTRTDPTNPNKFVGPKNGGCFQRVDIDEGSRKGPDLLVAANFETCDTDRGYIQGVRVKRDKADTGKSDTVNSQNTTGAGGTSQNGVAPPSCESNNKNVLLGWILCSVVNFVDDSMNKLAQSVDGLLDIKQDEYDRPEFKAVWSYFKNIASFLLVGVALVAIIGQALRGE